MDTSAIARFRGWLCGSKPRTMKTFSDDQAVQSILGTATHGVVTELHRAPDGDRLLIALHVRTGNEKPHQTQERVEILSLRLDSLPKGADFNAVTVWKHIRDQIEADIKVRVTRLLELGAPDNIIRSAGITDDDINRYCR